MVNYGLNTASLLGLFYFILGIAYLAFSILLIIQRPNNLNNLGLALYLGQAIISPLILLICGFILIFQGWRLDPILQFQQFLLTLLIIYLGIKDILINFSGRGR